MTHRIQLRGPWEVRPLRVTQEGVELETLWERITLPAVCRLPSDDAYAGRLRFRRRFGRPANLPDQEQVWLCTANWPEDVTCFLNGQRIDSFAAQEAIDITALLQRRNELWLDATPSILPASDSPEPLLEVWLEFRQ